MLVLTHGLDFFLFAQMCLSFAELRKLALVLVEGWMAIIRSQSVSSGASPNGNAVYSLFGSCRDFITLLCFIPTRNVL